MAKLNTESPLVKSVLALDEYIAELERVGGKINSMELKSEFDLEHVRRLLTRFAECGQGVSDELTKLSTHLNEARSRAETVAGQVAQKANLLNDRKTDQQAKLDQFRILGEKVRDLNASMAALRRPEDAVLTEEERKEISDRLLDFEKQLDPLIEEAQNLREEAHSSRMKALEQNADSLAQTLLAVRDKIRTLSAVQH